MKAMRKNAAISMKRFSVKRFSAGLFVFSCAFYYMFGSLINEAVFLSANQARLLWVGAVLLIAASYFVYGKGKIPIKMTNRLFPFAVLSFALLCTASVLWATDSAMAYSRASLLVKFIITLFFLSILFREADDVRNLLKSIEYGGYMTILYIISQNGISSMISMFNTGSRLNYTGAHTNLLGMLAAYSIIICVYFLAEDGFRLSSLLAIPSLLILIMSVSKKAIFALLFGVALFFVLNAVKRKKILENFLKIGFLSLGLLMAVYILFKLPFMAQITKRIHALLRALTGGADASGVDYSTSMRISLIKTGWKIFREHPLLGVGLDNARLYSARNLYLHNNYVEIMADLGVVGLLVYYFPYGVNAAAFLKYRDTGDHEFNICLTLFLLMLILDLGKVSYYSMSTYYFLLLFCLKARLMKEKARSHAQPAKGS